ncbi:MAG: hypothetical protein RI975_931 [Pseudomonadota bacterium]|jgi:hypothetical protein
MNLEFLGTRDTIAEYWNKRSIHFKPTHSTALDLPSLGELIATFTGFFTENKWNNPINVKINASQIDNTGTHNQKLSININEGMELFKLGYTLCFGDLSNDISSIRDLKNESSNIFNIPELIAVTGYISPINSVGVLHYDRQHNFFIQAEGTKRWNVSNTAAVLNPYENLLYPGLNQAYIEEMNSRGYEIKLPKDCGRTVYDLQPGEVLYVPPGFYHSPETIEGTSLHYTLTIEPACFWKDLNKELFNKMLNSKGKFLQDYRFMSSTEKDKFIQSCMNDLRM